MMLYSTDDVAACVNVLFEHMARSDELAKAADQPIKWNPFNQSVMDHRDGTVNSETTGYILRAIAA
jgi:hypothetical protein